jgi:hypothetical protein
MWKKLPGLIWVVALVVLAERKFAPGTFAKLFSSTPMPSNTPPTGPVIA